MIFHGIALWARRAAERRRRRAATAAAGELERAVRAGRHPSVRAYSEDHLVAQRRRRRR